MADVRLDGADAASIAQRCRVPRVELLDETTSTLDVAHALASAGAPAGTLVLANRQTAGRGRAGKTWSSESGGGLWLTLIERPDDGAAVGVVSLRIGLALALALDRYCDGPVRLKWPNDLWIGARKLAGVLAEARWRDGVLEWVAIGIGINVRAPAAIAGGTGLRVGTERLDVLRVAVPAVRGAVARRGNLSVDELAAYASRDLAVGRTIIQPAVGTALGIAADGALAVATATGRVHCHAGSLVFAEAEASSSLESAQSGEGRNSTLPT